MRKITLYFVAILLIGLVSCSKSKYRYIELRNEVSVVTGQVEEKEQEEEIIKANSDSAAYCEAFEKFCITLVAEKETADALGGSISFATIDFKLINEQGKDISKSVIFEGKEDFEKTKFEEIVGVMEDVHDTDSIN